MKNPKIHIGALKGFLVALFSLLLGLLMGSILLNHEIGMAFALISFTTALVLIGILIGICKIK